MKRQRRLGPARLLILMMLGACSSNDPLDSGRPDASHAPDAAVDAPEQSRDASAAGDAATADLSAAVDLTPAPDLANSVDASMDAGGGDGSFGGARLVQTKDCIQC